MKTRIDFNEWHVDEDHDIVVTNEYGHDIYLTKDDLDKMIFMIMKEKVKEDE